MYKNFVCFFVSSKMVALRTFVKTRHVVNTFQMKNGSKTRKYRKAFQSKANHLLADSGLASMVSRARGISKWTSLNRSGGWGRHVTSNRPTASWVVVSGRFLYKQTDRQNWKYYIRELCCGRKQFLSQNGHPKNVFTLSRSELESEKFLWCLPFFFDLFLLLFDLWSLAPIFAWCEWAFKILCVTCLATCRTKGGRQLVYL